MSAIDELRKSFEEPTDDDLIKASFWCLKRGEVPNDPALFHRFFYEMKDRYPNLFTNFYFSSSGITPYSDLLDRIFFRVETALIMERVVPGFSAYRLRTKSLKRSFDKYDPEMQRVIMEIGKALAQAIFR